MPSITHPIKVFASIFRKSFKNVFPSLSHSLFHSRSDPARSPFYAFALLGVAGWFGMFASGCAPRIASAPDIETLNCRQAIVFIPGYKGSVLADDDNDVRWISASEVLFGSRPLTLASTATKVDPGAPTDSARESFAGSAAASSLHPIGVLRTIPLFLGINVYDAYDTPLRALENRYVRNGACLIPFPYDWRVDNRRTAAKLRTLLETLRNRGTEKIVLVAHSMGGIVTTLMLRQSIEDGGFERAARGPQGSENGSMPVPLVDGVILAGVPFHGSIFLMRDLHDGIETVTNSALLTAAAVSTFDTPYQLLPAPEDTALIDAEGRPGPSLYEASNWDRFGWGICAHLPAAERSACVARRNRGLEEGLDVHRRLHTPLARVPGVRIPILLIRGYSFASLTRGLVTEGGLEFPQADRAGETRYAHLFDDGDGVVSVENSLLPPPLCAIADVREHEIPVYHDRLLTSELSRDDLLDFVGEIFSGGRVSGVRTAGGR